MTLSTLCKEAHDNSVAKGFYDMPRKIDGLAMLCVCELAEAVEADRENRESPTAYDLAYYANKADFSDHDVREMFKSKVKDTVGDEIADCLIRLCDMCGFLNIDLESHVKAKMKYNATREKLHGKKY